MSLDTTLRQIVQEELAPVLEALRGAKTIRKTLLISEASEQTGLPQHLIREAVRTGKLPSFMAGKKYRIYADDLVNWIESLK